MNSEKIKEIAGTLDSARLERREVPRLTSTLPDLTLEEAYQIQDEGALLRLNRGEEITGFKMGLTSKPKMRQMGVDAPIYGVLTGSMKLKNESRFSIREGIHPKIEPEVAFFIDQDIRASLSPLEVLKHCSGVCAAMEIIDSRYLNFDFLLPDVIADNCSASAFILGPVIKNPRELDLGNLGMLLEIDGKPVQFGSSAAILGNPLNSLAELCKMLSSRGRTLKAGSIVLAGAATQAIALEPDQRIKASVQDLGTVDLHT